MKVKVRQPMLRQLRSQRAWTQEELAEHAHVHSRTIQRLENEGVGSLQTLHRVARALEVDPDSLEYASDAIDFGPLLVELRIVLLAIARKVMPSHERQLPNSFVGLVVAIGFGASFTLVSVVLTIAGSLEQNLDNPVALVIYALALAFCVFFISMIWPLLRLRPWARTGMLAICWTFFAINTALLAQALVGRPQGSGSLWEYAANLLVTLWMYRVLTRGDVRRLFLPDEPPDLTRRTP